MWGGTAPTPENRSPAHEGAAGGRSFTGAKLARKAWSARGRFRFDARRRSAGDQDRRAKLKNGGFLGGPF